MNVKMSLFCEIKYKDLTNKIKETKYTEGNNELQIINKRENKKRNNDILDCILSKYDIEYETADNKDMYKDKKLIEIASKIDEESNSHYDCFKYRKNFSKKLIQRGLLQHNSLSTILYLIDYYKSNIVIYDSNLKKYINLSTKYDKNDIYEFDGRMWGIMEDIEIPKEKSEFINETHHYFKNNVKSLHIYDTGLKSIGNYTAVQLHELAKKKNIDIHINNKKMTKKDIYDKLYDYCC